MSIYFLAAVSETVEHADEHSNGTFPPFDPTYFSAQLFWLAVTFGLLLFLLAKVFLPRLGGIIEDRGNHIADDLDAAARMQRETELAEKKYEQALADAWVKAHNVAETTRASVDAEIAAETEAADAEAATQIAKSEAKIRVMKETALANVEDIATDTTRVLLDTLHGGRLTAANIHKAVKALE